MNSIQFNFFKCNKILKFHFYQQITLVVGNGLQPLDIEALSDMEDNILRTGGGEEPEIIETTIESFR